MSDAASEQELQDRALKLSDALDGPIEDAQRMRAELMDLSRPSRQEQRRAEHIAKAIEYLREAKGALLRAGKE